MEAFMKLIDWIPLVTAVNNGWSFAALALVLVAWLYVRRKDID
jgi:hypothetical protein